MCNINSCPNGYTGGKDNKMFKVNYTKTNNETVDNAINAIISIMEDVINKNQKITEFEHGMYEGKLSTLMLMHVLTFNESQRISKEFFRLCYHLNEGKAVEK